MDYSRIMSFRGKWRNYQARVLKNADRYIRDGRIHIVAAPVSAVCRHLSGYRNSSGPTLPKSSFACSETASARHCMRRDF